MFKNIYLKTLYSLRWQLAGWSLAVAAIAFLTMLVYPSFSQDGIENIVNSVPEELQALVGNVADYKTIPGFIGQQVFGPNLYIITLIMTILVFLGISASEESDGRLQSLLSFPVSRSAVYFQKWLAASMVVAAISATVLAGTWLALLLINESADTARLLESTGALILINLAYGVLAFAVAFMTGSKGVTILVVSLYTVASFFVTSLAPAVDALKDVDKLSLLHYYNNPQIMSNGTEVNHIIVLIAAILGLTLLGWFGFLRRDVQTN